MNEGQLDHTSEHPVNREIGKEDFRTETSLEQSFSWIYIFFCINRSDVISYSRSVWKNNVFLY